MFPHAVAYVRRSSDREDYQILSIEQQLEELRRLAAVRGFEVVEEFVENASASEPGRPVFGQLLRQIKAGKVDRVLVWKPDRLARNMVDGGALIYELQQGRLKEIITPEATYTGAGDSKFMLVMLFGAAAKYTDDLSVAVHRGERDVLKRGKVPGPVPLGYLKSHEYEPTPGSGMVIPDPERFDTVKRIWKEVLGGTTNVSEIWRRARYDWGLTTRPTKSKLAHPVSIANLYAILRNPFYSGQVVWGKETFKGEHLPMVTVEEFEQVQSRIGHPVPTPSHTHNFLYQGLLRCGGCQRALTGELHEKEGHAYIYYRCGRRAAGHYRCHEPAVTEHDLTASLAEILDRVIVDPTVRDWAYEAIAWWAGEDPTSPEKLVRRAKSSLARAEHELATMTDLVVSGRISPEEYTFRRTHQLVKIAHLREALADPVQKLATWHAVRDEKQKNGLKLGDEFRNGNDASKRIIVTRTCSQVLITDKKPRVELRAPFILRPTAPNLQDGLPPVFRDASSQKVIKTRPF